jgi:tRNA 2-selenouridine synthase
MINKINVADFLQLEQNLLIIDVRSPIEFEHAQFPYATNIPLFTNEERAIVGTIYKQQGRQAAIKKGLTFFGTKTISIIEDIELLLKKSNQHQIGLYCARGGMRSNAIAWLLNMYGFDVYVCGGGYKSIRNWVLAQFEKQYHLHLISGYTGSGKTKILLQKTNYIDIEQLANHKGSAFGGIGMPMQPTQEMFENKLAFELYKNAQKEQPIWLEDESQRLGKNFIPHSFWQQMRNATYDLTTVNFETRLNNILLEYGNLPHQNLEIAIKSITKRLGGLQTKNALLALANNDLNTCFAILLQYYDKQYDMAFAKRINENK